VVKNSFREDTVKIRNSGDLAIKGIKWNLAGEGDFEIINPAPQQGETLSGRDTLNIRVRFTPQSTVNQKETLSVTTSDNQSLTVILQGEGISGPAIAVEPKNLLFDVPVNSEAVSTVVISNSGDQPLTVQEVVLEQMTKKITFDFHGIVFPVRIEPAGEITFYVEFSPTKRDTLENVIQIESNALNVQGALKLGIKAIAYLPGKLVADSTALNFGDVQIDAAKILQIIITNSGEKVVSNIRQNIFIFGADSELFSLAGEIPDSLPSQKQDSVNVTFSPDKQSKDGAKNALLVIKYKSGSKQRSIQISLTGWAKLPQLVEVDQYDLAFGTINIGKDSTRYISITNKSQVDTITVTPTLEDTNSIVWGFVWEKSKNIDPNTSDSIAVTFAPKHPQQYRETLTLHYSVAQDTVIQTLSISLQGQGLSNESGLVKALRSVPNPFNPYDGESARIKFQIQAEPEELFIRFYDTAGRVIQEFNEEEIKRIMNDGFPVQFPGEIVFPWNGRGNYTERGDQGKHTRLAYGVYICEVYAKAQGKTDRKFFKIAIFGKSGS